MSGSGRTKRKADDSFGDLHPERRAIIAKYVEIEKLGRDLSNSFHRNLPTVSQPYSKVKCLLLAWKHMYESDEVSTRTDLDLFDKTMRESYGYSTERYLIDGDVEPRLLLRNLDRKLAEEGPDEGDLLIVYYVGHGYTRESDRKYYLTSSAFNHPGRRAEICFQLSFSSLINFPLGDVCFFIDACYSSGTGLDNPREVLAASAIEQVADSRIQGLETFTQAFCELLKKSDQPRTIAYFHAEMIENWQNPEIEPASNLQITPVHKADRDRGRGSIVLTPLLSKKTGKSLEKQPYRPRTSKVLITVNVLDDSPTNLEEWKAWLSHYIPSDVSDIQVEGVWKKGSSLVLLSLPVSIWDMLVDDPAYSFVGYVVSPNLLLQENAPVPSLGLSLREREIRKENVRPGSSGRK